ncbi:MAG: hypothetical protein ACFFEK_02250 [Candidatus Thorarchaeota archaeon]
MRLRRQNVLVYSVILTILMPLAIMPLSSPVLANLVVRMSDDVSTEQAITTLECNTQNLVVVDYGSLEYFLMIGRAVETVIWVSHGSDQGILVGNSVMSWQRFSYDIKMTPSRDVVLACDSSELSSYLSPGEAFLFDGAIEATLGALIASFILNGAIVMQSLLTALTSLALGVIQIHFLILTFMEYVWDTFNFVISVALCGIGAFILTETVEVAVLHSCQLLFYDTFLIAGEVAQGKASWLSLIGPLITLMCAIIGGLALYFPQYSVLMAADELMLATPAGWFLIAANIGIYIATLYYDSLD